MKIVIRMDDIAPGMDMGKFRRFKRILDEHGIKPLIGVVPDNEDPKLMAGDDDDVRIAQDTESGVKVSDREEGPFDIEDNKDEGFGSEKDAEFWRMVRSLQTEGWIIAMHGLHHKYTTKKGGLLPLNKQSEFAGIDLEEQIKMLRQGKKILESHGIATDFFMAPSHSYDKNTIRALLETGFRRITDGFGTKAYRRFDITFYPISYNKKSAVKNNSEGFTTFVVHTGTMTGDDFAYYEKLFSEKNVVSFNEWLSVEPVEASDFQGIKEYIMARVKYILVHKKF